MRKVSGFVLTLLGTFLIVVAALLRFWLAPTAIKLPGADEFQKLTLAGSGSYFSQVQSLLGEQTGVSVQVTYTQKGNPQTNGGTSVYDFFTSVQDLTNKQPISYISYREAFDRRSGELSDCCGEYTSDPITGKPDKSVRMSGLGVFFPIGTKAQTYTIFDPMASKPESALYDGGFTVDGILTYKFVEKVSPTKIGTYPVPGSLLGDPFEPSVTLGEYYSATNTFYVDPETGAPLDIAENQTVTLGNSGSDVQLLASNISVGTTKQSIDSVASADKSARNKILLIQDVLPIIGLILGIVLLIIGIIVLWLERDREEPDGRLMHELDTYA